MNIQIKRLTETAKLPTKGSTSAAGYDLYANLLAPMTIAPHSTEKIGTGIAVALPDGTFGAIFARSGLATKRGLRPANCTGVIDSDYRGELIVALHNDTDTPKTIDPNERIAQLIVLPFVSIDFEEVENLNETQRGSSGFGGSGRF